MALPPDALADIVRRRLGLQTEADMSRRRITQDYETGASRINEQKGEAVRDLGDQFAARGMFNSGIRLNQQGQVERTAAQRIGDLLSSRNRGLEDVEYGFNKGMGDLGAYQAQMEADYTRQMQQDALSQSLMGAQIEAQRKQTEMAAMLMRLQQGAAYGPPPKATPAVASYGPRPRNDRIRPATGTATYRY